VAKAKVSDIEISYQVTGQGHPLLLIAGVGYGGWFWHKVVPGLAEHYQVITFDNRGAGDSDKPDSTKQRSTFKTPTWPKDMSVTKGGEKFRHIRPGASIEEGLQIIKIFQFMC